LIKTKTHCKNSFRWFGCKDENGKTWLLLAVKAKVVGGVQKWLRQDVSLCWYTSRCILYTAGMYTLRQNGDNRAGGY